jgi:hypothetical protein
LQKVLPQIREDLETRLSVLLGARALRQQFKKRELWQLFGNFNVQALQNPSFLQDSCIFLESFCSCFPELFLGFP